MTRSDIEMAILRLTLLKAEEELATARAVREREEIHTKWFKDLLDKEETLVALPSMKGEMS